MSDEENKHLCKGCHAYDEGWKYQHPPYRYCAPMNPKYKGHRVPALVRGLSGKPCPCQECIIKTTCGQVCPELHEYLKKRTDKDGRVVYRFDDDE